MSVQLQAFNLTIKEEPPTSTGKPHMPIHACYMEVVQSFVAEHILVVVASAIGACI